MNESAVIAATFSDWRPVKSRKVLQLIFEVPVEKTEEVLKALGAPMPHEDKWCAVTLLKEEPKPDKPKKRFDEMSRAQQAAVLGSDPSFQDWAWAFFKIEMPIDHCNVEEVLANQIRQLCNVSSRRYIDGNVAAEIAFDAMIITYRQATGQMAEERG